MDVVIVGAGTAGAAAALLMAERGLKVLCLERGSLERAGARWVNGVPEWAFRESGIEVPAGDELRGSDHAFHLVSGWGPRRLVVRDHGLLEVDMRRLVERLHAGARAAGAEIVAGVRVVGRSTTALETSIGPIEARWFVDASGLSGAGLVPAPEVARTDLCSAAQEVRQVNDRTRARDFFESHGVRPGETLCFTGVAGGFSVVNLRLDDEGISILTGSVAAEGHPSGPRLLADFVQRHDWIGASLFGGSRAIPLRRPFDRLAHGAAALLGDAGCQVFSAHGSGIGAGLLAARVLAETFARGGSAHDYAVDWQRRWGGLLAGYDVFRRFSQTLTPPEIERLMDSGLLDEWSARSGLAQRFPRLEARTAAGRLVALARVLGQENDLGRRLARTALRMSAAGALYALYPRSQERLAAWSRLTARALGVTPDIG